MVRGLRGGWTLLLPVAFALACSGKAADDPDPPSPVLDPVAMPEEPEAARPTCEPVDGSLDPGARLPNRIGSYALTLVRGDGGARPAWVEGSLRLEPRAPDLRPTGEWEAPLLGVAEIEIQRVGAFRAGSLTSEDPGAPGVLVLRGPDTDPGILLRLGSAANRTDRMAFDEAFTVLEVRRITDDGFAGAWRSGRFEDQVSGHFCAVAAGD